MDHSSSLTDRRTGTGAAGRFAIVIPVYNHSRQVEGVIAEALKLDLPIFVVDDGSTDDTCRRISRYQEISILRHEKNRGKGAALMTGFRKAARIADWAITLDADGQHNPGDATVLMKAAEQSPGAFIIGHRMGMDNPNVRWTSRFGRKFSNFWVRACGGPVMADSQSGFRIYPLPKATRLGASSRRFEFEVEILVLAHWHRIPVVEVPVGVNYLPRHERISHFRPWRDFFRNSKTFSSLLLRRFFFKPAAVEYDDVPG